MMMVPFINGWTSSVESSAIGAMTAFFVAVDQKAHDKSGLRSLGAPDARYLVYVHVDYPGGDGLFVWCSLTGSAQWV